ncbi:PREDICTED: UPF0415 protein C7orf25 homolog [Fragaria vesca subsp. vesca]|uniref:UPF0415 protein C7orf25 homolog n=1 Tax=Fragaria vesca subsp. vesca TaxID=101020 RepID=UPI0002C347C5|nr:PREDICTED: UPF0415 protein C7orf25 homolog [Fragaria vesca subsp. vesca]XP_011464434.1 PREDICTED: UPF0415 protein C7orf25 homolog [Fragaria vesca subsp. vesca]
MELGAAKKRCRDVIERIERLPSSTKITPSCKRTLLKLAHSELSFLSRSTSSTPLSVNIGHIETVVHILHHPLITGVSRVCKPIPMCHKTSSQNGHVDIVCTLNRNPVWIIVSDRNPNYITWNEPQTNKTKGLQCRVQQLTAAAASAVALRPSSVILFFSHGLSSFLSDKLKHEFEATQVQLCHPGFRFDLVEEEGDWIDVLVARTYQEAAVFEIKVGDVKDDDVLSSVSDVKVSPMAANWDLLEDTTLLFPGFYSAVSKMQLFSFDVENMETAKRGECDVVNFDTTALIALVSAISNGGTEKLLATPESELRQRFKGNYEFVIGQVMSEIQNPILVKLGSAISGKRGITCETVHSEFKELVSMYGGPNEKLRASHLLKYLRVVPDSPSKRMMSLPTTRKLALKCKIVFGTGDYWCAPTATANMAFVRAVSQAGMSLCTIEHRPRALTGD